MPFSLSTLDQGTASGGSQSPLRSNSLWVTRIADICGCTSLAYMEMRIILARVIWNFDMTLADESQDWHARQKVYIMWDKGPLIVHLQPVARG
jgi:hypothetical protein